MAKSKIIKDLANGDASTSVALKRAKVLLQELKNEDLLQWVNYELTGYPNHVELPAYRITTGQVYGSYLKGSMSHHLQCTNVALPLGDMPESLKDSLLTVQFREGIESLIQLLEGSTNGGLVKPIPPDLFPAFPTYNHDPYMYITSANVIINAKSIQNVMSTIESKLLDFFCYLEKQFGILDNLDIDVSQKSSEETNTIINNIHIMLYSDNRVTIGDGNKIKDSTVASSLS